MKKIALAVLLAFTLLPAASFAQVVVRIGPPAPMCRSAARRRRTAALCGSTAIIAGMATIMSGRRAAGIARHIPARIGLRTAGFTAGDIGSW